MTVFVLVVISEFLICATDASTTVKVTQGRITHGSTLQCVVPPNSTTRKGPVDSLRGEDATFSDRRSICHLTNRKLVISIQTFEIDLQKSD